MGEEYVDRYKIVETLGTGSMGVVYKAVDPDIDRVVAVKTLRSMFLGNDEAGTEALNRFKQESRSAGRLQHPNIVTIYSAGKTEDGSPFIVMEHVEGDSLEEMIASGEEISEAAVLHYLAQIGSAIDFAHGHNIIHRDIKPSNVIVDASFRPQLLDFGVAKMSDTSLTPAGTVVGTPSYMSPEQIRGEKLTGKSDLFSFAVLAYEMFTLKRPFPGKDFTSVVSNIIHKDPLSFEEIESSRSKDLEEVLVQGLSKDKDGRFETALDFVKAIARILGYEVDASGLIGGYDPDAVVEPNKPTKGGSSERVESRSNKTSMIFVALIALAAVGYYLGQSAPEEIVVVEEPVVEEPQKKEESQYVVSMTNPVEEAVRLEANSLELASDQSLKTFAQNGVFSEDDYKLLFAEAERRGGDTGLWLATQGLQNDSYKVRVGALKLLGKGIFPEENSFELIANRLKNDTEFLVRGFAAKILTKIDSAAAVNVLRAHRKNETDKIVNKVIDKQLQRYATLDKGAGNEE